MTKSYIDKHDVIRLITDEGVVGIAPLIREIKIDYIFKYDILVMDNWVSKFYEDLNPLERDIRKYLTEKYMFDSSDNFVRDKDFESLTSVSEALISLVNNPLWIDIFFISNKFNLITTKDESGDFIKLKQKCIDAAIKYFD